MTASTQFVGSAPRRWNGRYSRIPGEKTTFHVKWNNGRWWPWVLWAVDDEVAQCPMVDSAAACALASAVNAGKTMLGGEPGGAFAVNEFNQVLAPDSAGRRVAIVGEFTGPLEFTNSFVGDTKTFDLV